MKKLSIATIMATLMALLVATAAFALFFSNGDFENPPVPQTSANWPSWNAAGQREFLKFTGGYDATGFPILSGAGADLSAIVGGPAVTALSISDPNTSNVLKYPAVGHYSARINSQDSYNTPGHGQNANTLFQTTLVDASDVDAGDSLVHLRMMYAAVMVDPTGFGTAHTAAETPMFFLEVRDVTANTVLVHRQSYAGEPGVPWQTGPRFPATGSQKGTWKFLDWTTIDVVAGDSSIVGHTLSVKIVATGCSLGGHPGYIYVDEVGSKHVGVPSVSASGPSTIASGATITYTYNYFNGTAGSVNQHVVSTQPTGVTFTSTGLPGSCSLASGVVTCDFTGVAAGTGGSFQIQGTVTAAAGSTISHGNYTNTTSGYPTTGGSPVVTIVPSSASPTITNITPNSGPITGGTSVVITGTALTGGSFTFGGTATTCTVASDGLSADCSSPAHAAGAVDVVVTTGVGSPYTFTNGFTYVSTPAPVITNGGTGGGISPNAGPIAGGTTVTITGTNFTGTTSVTFGGTAVNLAACTVTDTLITCPTPAHVAGPVDVVVTTPSGSSTSTDGFTYYGVPNVTSGSTGGGISPNVGPVTGGTTVTITGTNFTGTTSVTFGGTAVNLAACTVTDTLITCPTPAHSAGLVDVIVNTPGGSATSTGGFTYVAVPTIFNGVSGGGISPNSGPIYGGTTVVITGTNLTGGTVKFDGIDAVCTVDSATQITCTTPAHTAGPVNVTVTTPGGTATSTGGFTYIVAVLTVTASGPATVYPGGQYTYTFAFTTTAMANNARVSFTLPGHTTYASNTGGYTCGSESGVVTCTLGTITANSSFDVTVNVDKLKKINTPLILATSAYSMNATGVTLVNGTATVTANTLNPFSDVPNSNWAIEYIQSVWAYGITYGCALPNPLTTYCPDQPVTRGEMSIFILRAVHTSAYNPGTPAITFTDTGTHFAKYWIEALKNDSITGGCGTIATFCPNSTIARVEMSVFLLRGQSWPATHVPPASTGMWPDVSPTHWGVNWADELGTSGISTGCGLGYFCPTNAVVRSEMAALVQRTFKLTMPSP